jgi:serine O-acetyltransferase
MIKNKEDLNYYIKQDLLMNGVKNKGGVQTFLKDFFFPDPIIKFLYYLRKVEYYSNVHSPINSLICTYYKIKLRKVELKLGFSIPQNVFGPGLSIPHYGTIVVNGNARVGANCRLHAGTNIGASAGSPEAPIIGDNVYIGPSTILFGNIKIASDVTIGGNSTVNKSCEQEHVVLAGCPAKIVKEKYPNWLIFNRIDADHAK